MTIKHAGESRSEIVPRAKRGATLRDTTRECPHCTGEGYFDCIDGAHMRELREERGLSLRELARRVDKTPAYISDIELGRRFVDPYTKLADAIRKALA